MDKSNLLPGNNIEDIKKLIAIKHNIKEAEKNTIIIGKKYLIANLNMFFLSRLSLVPIFDNKKLDKGFAIKAKIFDVDDALK